MARDVLPVPPSIADSPSEYYVREGSSVRLTCDVEGDPKPQITWTKNGMRISDSGPHYFMDGSGSLEVLSADRRDTGAYSCTAVSVAGLREKRISLHVHSQSHTILYRLLSLHNRTEQNRNSFISIIA